MTGFATGVRQDDGDYQVRDVDAHFWIEVYFQGYGWVAFNPTPPAAHANIPGQLDPLAAATTGDHGGHGPGRPGRPALGAILAALATVGVWFARWRSRPRPAPIEPLLESLVRRTGGGHVQPSSTLAELAGELTRLAGPNTAALAIQAEHTRYAPDPATPTRRPRIHLARALAKDLGLLRALIVLVAPAATRRMQERSPRTAPHRRHRKASEAADSSAPPSGVEAALDGSMGEVCLDRFGLPNRLAAYGRDTDHRINHRIALSFQCGLPLLRFGGPTRREPRGTKCHQAP